MDEFERYETDELKSSRTRDKHESKHENKHESKHERSRIRKTKSDKDRSPIHSHRYVIFKYFLYYISFQVFTQYLKIQIAKII